MKSVGTFAAFVVLVFIFRYNHVKSLRSSRGALSSFVQIDNFLYHQRTLWFSCSTWSLLTLPLLQSIARAVLPAAPCEQAQHINPRAIPPRAIP